MLPHPTTSSFVSTMAESRLAICGARVGLADPSMLERFGTHLAQLRESGAEFDPFVAAQRRRSHGGRVALDDAEFFQRRLQARDGRTIGLATALERRRDAKFFDCLFVQLHQLAFR